MVVYGVVRSTALLSCSNFPPCDRCALLPFVESAIFVAASLRFRKLAKIRSATQFEGQIRAAEFEHAQILKQIAEFIELKAGRIFENLRRFGVKTANFAKICENLAK